MKQIKKWTALLLACALGASLLSGCSAGEGGASSTDCPGAPSDCPTALPPSAPWPYAEKLSIQPKDSGTVNAALSRFGLELLQKAREAGDGPVLLSPLSVALALSMAANGTDGETLAQFQEVLGGGADLDELNAACAQFMFDYQGLPGSTKFSIANSLWADCQGGIYKEFVSKCRGYLSAHVYEADLSDQRIVGDVNQWVSEKTNGMIPGIIQEPFDEDVVCLLINALYLKNAWLHEFDPYATHEMDFHHADGSASRTDYLQHFDTKLSYIKDKGAQGVVLPYDDGRLGFFALLPDLYPDAPDLGEWLSSLEGGDLSRLIDSREDAFFLRFAMPKFSAEWSGELKEILPLLGLEDAFAPGKADFSKLGDCEFGYYLSQVVHAAKIEVNEKGTEATAATLAAPAAGAPLPDPEGVTLILDRPFLYGIVDLQTNVPLFLGTFE